jgi:hypothetical protein
MATLQNTNEQTLIDEHEIIESFFRTDSASEMIESLHVMAESFLFGENLKHITPEMRVHLVNQLRVASLVAKLGEGCRQ